MTNVYLPLGFQVDSNKFNSGAEHLARYAIQAANTDIFGLNDLVKISSAGGNFITKCTAADTPIGFFKGWNFRTRSPYGGSQGQAADGRIVPWFKAWTGAVTANTNQYIEALVDDDPSLSMVAQMFSSTALTQADLGKLVDMADCPAGPDITVFGRGKQGVTYVTTYYNITGYTVSAGGSGYTQNGVDLVINGLIIDTRPGDIVVSGGAVSSISLLNNVSGLPNNTPTLALQPKPGFGGSGATITANSVSGAQTAAQFRVDDFIEKPFRAVDSQNNTTGIDLTNVGVYPWVRITFAKHKRGGSALYV